MQVPRYRLLLAGTAALTALTLAGSAHALSVHVQRHRAVRQNVHITFRAHKLPEHGYYYAVIVLRPYKHYTASSPPPCSPSSNMWATNYGYPRPDGEVKLTLTSILTPTEGPTKQWCPGGSYEGGVYAVPHPPPCESRYPCRSEPYKQPNRKPCTGSPSTCFFGVVARPGQYAYPDPLPKPLASDTRTVARFTVRFP
jgi:hypothetical protein